jgi:hypothetical protein
MVDFDSPILVWPMANVHICSGVNYCTCNNLDVVRRVLILPVPHAARPPYVAFDSYRNDWY